MGAGRTGGIAEGPSPARVGPTRCKAGDGAVPTARPPTGDSRLPAGLRSPRRSRVNPCAVTPGSVSLGRIRGGLLPCRGRGSPENYAAPPHHAPRPQIPKASPAPKSIPSSQCPRVPVTGAVAKPLALGLVAGATVRDGTGIVASKALSSGCPGAHRAMPSKALPQGTRWPHEQGARRVLAPCWVWLAGRSRERAPKNIVGGCFGLGHIKPSSQPRPWQGSRPGWMEL